MSNELVKVDGSKVISEAMETQFWEAVQNSKWLCTTKFPFWSVLLYKFKYHMEPGIPTAAVDDNFNVWINPEFFVSLPAHSACFVIAHECSHPAFRHLTRLFDLFRDNRYREFTDKNGVIGRVDMYDLSNRAADYSVNWMLQESFNKSDNPKLHNPIPKDKDGNYKWLYKEEYIGLTAEEILADLLKKMDSSEFEFAMSGGMPQSGGSGDKDSDSKDSDKGGKDFKINGESGDVLDDHIKDTASGDGTTESTLKEQSKAKQFESALRSGAEMARGRGLLPDSIQKIVSKLLEPEVNWTDVLTGMIGKLLNEYAGHTDSSWSRFNRRMITYGFYLPGMIGDRVSIVVGLDVSGSMHRYAVQAVTEIDGLRNQYTSTEMRAVTCDAAIQNEIVCDNDTPFNYEQLDTLLGTGGGTVLAPIFDYVHKTFVDIPQPDLVVIVTDGDIDNINEHPDAEYDTVWLVFNSPGFKPNFGEVIHANV